jgi:hypothetical protein
LSYTTAGRINRPSRPRIALDNLPPKDNCRRDIIAAQQRWRLKQEKYEGQESRRPRG